ncbi:hypothetical protein [Rhizorhapis suberifaciens]|uniref:Uncharacterized protein n=1 Tax=Rhizorhapis suberifaciens TaxID=13656 RepID=A0A840HQC3_9SPHN|nr:hypothetical protein [Rhizorhapis suberifaciens]MBB4639820.1 hypothetical protein [Rhizorhapis suberifaciens]
MSIILTEADLAALAHYPLSLQEAARALWSGREAVPIQHAEDLPSANTRTRPKAR